jgi:hypothetical protein
VEEEGLASTTDPVALEIMEQCAPIQCSEDDEGPDFTRMAKKSDKKAGDNTAKG